MENTVEHIKPRVELNSKGITVAILLDMCTEALEEIGEYHKIRELIDKVYANNFNYKSINNMLEYCEIV